MTTFEVAYKLHTHVLPYYRDVANNLGVTENLLCLSLRCKKWIQLSFNPLIGIFQTKSCAITELIFDSENDLAQIIGINFLACSNPHSYIAAVQASVVFPESVDDKIQSLLHTWFEVSRQASIDFFNTPQSLSAYFRDSGTIRKWWTRDRTGTRIHDEYLTYIREYILRSKRWESVLEVGSGFGRTIDCYPGVNRLVLSDISCEMVAQIPSSKRTRKNQIIFDVNHIPISHGVFDLAVMLQLSMHLSNPFDLLDSLYTTCVSCSGCLLVDFTCIDRDKSGVDWLQKSPITRLYSHDYITTKLSNTNFSIVNEIEYQESSTTKWIALLLTKE